MVTQQYLTANVLNRVFWLAQRGNPVGTGFAIDVNGKQYLVTAQHVASSCHYDPEIRVRSGESWSSVHLGWRTIGEDVEADVAVLSASSSLCTSDLAVTVGQAGIIYGTFGYALGFPSALRPSDVGWLPGGRPTPVPALAVMYFSQEGKTGCCSGYITNGYSGGPILFPKSGEKPNEWAFAGVCTGFPTLRRPIDMDGSPVEFAAHEPTGLIRMANIQIAEAIISDNPAGFQL